MSKRLLGSLAVGGALLMGSALLAQQVAVSQPATVDAATRRQQLRIYSSYEGGGLEAAAAVTGFFEIELPAYPENAFVDLDDLVKFSDLVLIGEVASNRARLDEGGKVIVTDNQVSIERVLKGNGKRGDLIEVAKLGGRVTFPNGHGARVITPDAFPMAAGQRYLLFLRAPTQQESGWRNQYRQSGQPVVPDYRLVHDAQGEYVLDKKSGRAIAFGARGDRNTLARSMSGKREAPLIAQVQQAIAHQREGK